MLYVPAGCLHQVYSCTELNIAVNYWFVEVRDPRIAYREAMSMAYRRFGLRQPLKAAVGAGLVAVTTGALRLKYVVQGGKVPVRAPLLGPATYGPQSSATTEAATKPATS